MTDRNAIVAALMLRTSLERADAERLLDDIINGRIDGLAAVGVQPQLSPDGGGRVYPFITDQSCFTHVFINNLPPCLSICLSI